MTLAVALVCPACRRFWTGPPGELPFPSPRGVLCSNEGHALRRRPDPVVVVNRDALPLELEATDGEIWLAEAAATRVAKLGLANRHAAPRRDRWGQDRDAFLAEQIVARHYGEKWTGVVPGAIDVGDKWEVRSIVNPSYGLVVRETDRRLPTFLVLVAGVVGRMVGRILGWQDADVVLARGRFHAGSNGESDYWTMAQSDLRRDNPPSE